MASLTARIFCAAGLIALAVVIGTPYLAVDHDHVGDESRAKCLVCSHLGQSLASAPPIPHLSFELFDLGAVASASETAVVFELPGENSVRAPPVT